MVFSSVPPYLDHHNWQHQLPQSNHQGAGGGAGDCDVENPNRPPPELPPQLGGSGVSVVGGGEGSIKPGSMIDRARLAKLPLPEPGLNCPRCDSTNTKFCYFNNYSLTQPRHFCKTCRRYWTRGGALRNVPVGGGCRRNKRSSKSRRSKSPSQSAHGSLSVSPPRSKSENMITNTQLPHPPSLHLPVMSSLSQYGGVGGNLRSNIARFQPQSEITNLQIGNGNNLNNMLSIGGGENWRLPFLPGFEVPNNTNQFNYQSEGVGSQSSLLIRGDISLNNNSGIDDDHNPHIDPLVKAEDNRGSDLSRQFLGMLEYTNPQPWAGNSWAEFPSVSTSTSTTHYL